MQLQYRAAEEDQTSQVRRSLQVGKHRCYGGMPGSRGPDPV